MRGKHERKEAQIRAARITPAGAGKTTMYETRNAKNEDHPRRCGENALAAALQASYSGSPPQVRGKLFPCFAIICGIRITPAGAGKTTAQSRVQVGAEDHPRRCGENLYFRNQQRIHRGSPPQVRGKLVRSTSTHITDKDHPRRCGENRMLHGSAPSK